MSESDAVSRADESGEEQVISDLIVVSELSDESIAATGAAFEADGKFVSDDSLKSIVAAQITDPDQAEAVLRVLSIFHVGNVREVLGYLQEWRQKDRANAELLTDDCFGKLKQKLPRLLHSSLPVQRYRKALNLSVGTGHTLQAVHLISDLRPVFDEEREQVEGLVPMTILRLTYLEQNSQQPKEMEFYLSRSRLGFLISEAEKAKKKLATLERVVGDWIPEGFVEPAK